MNGKRARQVRKALGYKKSPDHIRERGGIREKDGELRMFFIRNPEANRYRWWKRGVRMKTLPLELLNHLVRQQELRLLSAQIDQHSGEGNE